MNERRGNVFFEKIKHHGVRKLQDSHFSGANLVGIRAHRRQNLVLI